MVPGEAAPPGMLLEMQKLKAHPKSTGSETLKAGLSNLCFNNLSREFPGGLMVRILSFHCCGLSSTPSWGTEILLVIWYYWGEKRKKTFPVDSDVIILRITESVTLATH